MLTIPQPFTTHKAGMLAFDHEGMLLVGIGDGGSGNDPLGSGQDRASLLGKLLRLDVDRGWPYATPTDNGFANDPEARPEVHAIGLRNPWRFSVDRDGGYIYIGDVGQGGWEEIDVLPPGAREPSFGWSEMEGRECFGGKPCRPQDHVPPAVAYAHAAADGGHCSVIGGYAYRGTAGSLPDGAYLYADYCSGTIWAVTATGLRAGEAVPAVVGQVPPGMARPSRSARTTPASCTCSPAPARCSRSTPRDRRASLPEGPATPPRDGAAPSAGCHRCGSSRPRCRHRAGRSPRR